MVESVDQTKFEIPTAGATLVEATSELTQPHTFKTCDPSSFALRVGPDYAQNKFKAAAGPSLYEVVGVE